MNTEAPRVHFRDKFPVILAAFAIFSLLGRGTLMTSDEGGIFNTGIALTRGTLAVGPGENNFRGADGRYYAVREILPSVLVIPGVLAGVLAERYFQLKERPPLAPGPDVEIQGLDMSSNWPLFIVSWFFGPCAIAVALGYLYEYLLLEKVTKRWALAITLAVGFATPLVVYSKTIFPQTLEAAIVMGCFVYARRWRERPGLTAGLALGAACALGLMARRAFAPEVPLFFGFLLLTGDTARRKRLVGAAAFVLPVVLAACIVGYVNHLKWGAWYEMGRGDREVFSTNLLVGVAGLLFSPGKSIFLYAPLCLLPLLMPRRILRSLPPEAILLFLVTAVYLALYGQWYDWWGGLCWGPRFLVPLIAPWATLLAPLVMQSPSRRFLAAFTCAVAVGIVVQMVGASIHPFWMKTVPDVDPFSPLNSHLVHSVRFLLRHGPDDYWLPVAVQSATPMGLRLIVASAAALLYSVWRIWRELSSVDFSDSLASQA
jgi:hypothetical protein